MTQFGEISSLQFVDEILPPLKNSSYYNTSRNRIYREENIYTYVHNHHATKGEIYWIVSDKAVTACVANHNKYDVYQSIFLYTVADVYTAEGPTPRSSYFITESCRMLRQC